MTRSILQSAIRSLAVSVLLGASDARAQVNTVDGFPMDAVVECSCLNAGQLPVGQRESDKVLNAIKPNDPAPQVRVQASGGGDGVLTSTFRTGAKPRRQRERCILIVDCLDRNNILLKSEGVPAGQAMKVQCPLGTTRVLTFCDGRENNVCHYGWK